MFSLMCKIYFWFVLEKKVFEKGRNIKKEEWFLWWGFLLLLFRLGLWIGLFMLLKLVLFFLLCFRVLLFVCLSLVFLVSLRMIWFLFMLLEFGVLGSEWIISVVEIINFWFKFYFYFVWLWKEIFVSWILRILIFLYLVRILRIVVVVRL